MWVKWAALAACCALVIGAAAFVVPMFHAGSSAPEAASAPTADTAAPEAPAEEEMEMTLEASEAPAEAMPEAAPAEPAEQKTRTLPGADCFTVVPESITRTSADFTLTNEDGAVLALRSEYWLETQAGSEWEMLTSNLFKAQNQTDEAAPESSVCTLHYDWQTLYGELDAGQIPPCPARDPAGRNRIHAVRRIYDRITKSFPAAFQNAAGSVHLGCI